ncbi:hypothetical protein LZ575_01820 [Antarcticibacterium sp. 1MA-6-2]|uniref:hypothetical protein n=1 Tax=Antarcticibacterium sp. 1MA-6-2 TaxID=2908210 RepID=UPI001F3052AF|nr:hypothetical protein [Antarcticibacterium sp. 1MA-6-2]UJH91507.1 hypothetical protein LZ575_01820 [Antarcticibacterium sp. 1MA-6-2]
MKLVIQLLLWIVIFFLGYLVFNSVYGPVQFNEVKEKRYAKVIERLKDIRAAQLAHQEVTGTFAKDFNGLVQFIDTAEYVLTQRRDSTVLDEEYKKTYGVDQYKDIIIIDTLGYASVKDSLFKRSNYREMMNVPVDGIDAKFEMDAGTVLKNDNKIPVFEAKVDKAVILHDQDKDLVMQEKQVVSVDQVNGAFIKVGSMEEVNTNGNWPQVYGANDQ